MWRFADPMVECAKCKHRFREDQLDPELLKARDVRLRWQLGDASIQHDVQTHVGAGRYRLGSYLRPERAGHVRQFQEHSRLVHPNFHSVWLKSAGIQNEIAPRDFLFRAREFEQMEIEYSSILAIQKKWRVRLIHCMKSSSIPCPARIVSHQDPQDRGADSDRAHYSSVRSTLNLIFHSAKRIARHCVSD